MCACSACFWWVAAAIMSHDQTKVFFTNRFSSTAPKSQLKQRALAAGVDSDTMAHTQMGLFYETP